MNSIILETKEIILEKEIREMKMGLNTLKIQVEDLKFRKMMK